MSPPLSMSPVLTVHCMVSYISVFCSLALKKLQFTAASKILRPGNDRGYASRLCTIDCCEKTVTTKGVNFSHLPIRKVIRARLLYFRSIFPFPYFGFCTSEFSTCPKCTLASPCTLGVDVLCFCFMLPLNRSKARSTLRSLPAQCLCTCMHKFSVLFLHVSLLGLQQTLSYSFSHIDSL